MGVLSADVLFGRWQRVADQSPVAATLQQEEQQPTDTSSTEPTNTSSTDASCRKEERSHPSNAQTIHSRTIHSNGRDSETETASPFDTAHATAAAPGTNNPAATTIASGDDSSAKLVSSRIEIESASRRGRVRGTPLQAPLAHTSHEHHAVPVRPGSGGRLAPVREAKWVPPVHAHPSQRRHVALTIAPAAGGAGLEGSDAAAVQRRESDGRDGVKQHETPAASARRAASPQPGGNQGSSADLDGLPRFATQRRRGSVSTPQASVANTGSAPQIKGSKSAAPATSSVAGIGKASAGIGKAPAGVVKAAHAKLPPAHQRAHALLAQFSSQQQQQQQRSGGQQQRSAAQRSAREVISPDTPPVTVGMRAPGFAPPSSGLQTYTSRKVPARAAAAAAQLQERPKSAGAAGGDSPAFALTGPAPGSATVA